MVRKEVKRQKDFKVYLENGKITNECVTKIILEDEVDVQNALQEIRRNIEMAEQQKKSIEIAIENFKKEEQAILSYLESQK